MARKLKVYEQSMSGSSYTQVPTIILKGQWLKAAGLEAGQCGEVVWEGEKNTPSKTTAPEPTTKKSLEEKIKNLDKSQREKLSRMIDKL